MNFIDPNNPLSIRRNMGFVPQQEYFLQGSILDDHCENLLHKLRGFCDNSDSPYERFHDHEMVFSIRSPAGTLTSLRIRKALEHADNPCHLRYLGAPEVGDKNRATMVRNYIDCSTSTNVVQFLTDMGFKLEYEFVLQGYMFRRGRMKVIVGKMFRILQPGNLTTENLEAHSQSYLVELSVVAPSGQDAIAEEMKQFAEQLKPLVNLEKVLKS